MDTQRGSCRFRRRGASLGGGVLLTGVQAETGHHWVMQVSQLCTLFSRAVVPAVFSILSLDIVRLVFSSPSSVLGRTHQTRGPFANSTLHLP